jgi:hypothetical protein
MPLTLLGDIVNYVPADAGNQAPRAAIIIGLHANGTADLQVFNGFVQGTTDVQNVSETVAATPGSFFSPRGTKGGGILHSPLNDSTDDIVALNDANVFVVTGDDLIIDAEYMTVTDATDPSNLKVTRAAGGSTIAAHAVGALVKIGIPLPAVEGAKRKAAHSHKS